jgi:hypothetical protein
MILREKGLLVNNLPRRNSHQYHHFSYITIPTMSLDIPVAAINTPQLLVRQLLAKEHATIVASHLLHVFPDGITIRFQANPNSANYGYPSSIPSTE